jgi:hypothetical protein
MMHPITLTRTMETHTHRWSRTVEREEVGDEGQVYRPIYGLWSGEGAHRIK